MIVMNIFTIKRHLILYLDLRVWRDPGTESYHYLFEAPFITPQDGAKGNIHKN
jgi:hypothetical protein